VLVLVDGARCAYRASGQGSGNLVELLQGHTEIRNAYPGEERQIQDGPRAVISPEQNPSHGPEQDICGELECDEEK